MTNSSTAKAEMLQRAVNIMAEIDDAKEGFKDFMQEVKAREDELGFSPKELKDALALLRKGPKKTVNKLNESLQFLRECKIQDAIESAFD